MRLDDDPAPRAAQDGAVFAPVRVKGTRRPRILAALVIAGVGGLVAIGALDRGTAPPQTAAIADATDAQATTLPTPTLRSIRPTPRASIQVPGSFNGPAGSPPFIDLDIRPAGSHLFIHGDVFSLDVVRVTVRLEDTAGNVAATKSVDIPGGSTAFRIGAVPRFDVHFLLADEVQADGFMVSVTALDSGGQRLTTMLQIVVRVPDSM
jgi:hypothetical protein